jgi:urease alpha subunit
MSTIKVNKLEQRSGCTATVGGGAGKTVTVDATTVTLGRCGATVSLWCWRCRWFRNSNNKI